MNQRSIHEGVLSPFIGPLLHYEVVDINDPGMPVQERCMYIVF
jgi:hypothetical protein